jgi:hypothetical protein
MWADVLLGEWENKFTTYLCEDQEKNRETISQSMCGEGTE